MSYISFSEEIFQTSSFSEEIFQTSGTNVTIPNAQWTAIGTVAAGAVYSIPSPPSSPVSPCTPVPVDVKADGRTLTDEDMMQIIHRCVMLCGKDDTIMLMVDKDCPSWVMAQLRATLSLVHQNTVVVPEPKRIELLREFPSGDERLTLLARIGIVWEDNPGLSLSQILNALFFEKENGFGRNTMTDEEIVSALELMWG